MSVSFVSVVRSSFLAKAGLALVVAGIGLPGYAGFNKVPARADLQKVEGVLAEGKQVTRTSKRRGQSTGTVSTYYELGVRQANGQLRTLHVPGTWVSRPQIESVLSRPVTAEVDEHENVLVLSGGGQPVLTYETSARGYDIDNKRYREMGAPALAFGVPLFLVGFFWKRRSLRKAVGA